MKISTNMTEIKELFAHHLGINVSELELTIEDAQSESTNGGWIINTKTTDGIPYDLNPDERIEIAFNSGTIDFGKADDWYSSWNINSKRLRIVKYRKVKK